MTRCLSSGNRQVAFDSSPACHPGLLELRTDVPCRHSAPKGGCVSAARSRLGTRIRSQVRHGAGGARAEAAGGFRSVYEVGRPALRHLFIDALEREETPGD